jgi:hypothetical protein
MRIRWNMLLGLAWSVALTGATGCRLLNDSNPLAPIAQVDPAPKFDSRADDDDDDGRDREGFDPEDFVQGVDHPYFPLPLGTRWTYEKETDEGLETVVVEVLHESKFILGVRATVVRDQVFLDGELKEDTFDWYAQDEDGNVWYLGEDTKEYEDGQVVSTAGSWEAGKDGATAGFIMLAEPEPGDEYQQELAPGVAEDQAEVIRLNARVTVPFGRFRSCLKTLETTPLDPSAREFKYYARGVGLVLVTDEQGGDREALVSMVRP